MKKINIVIPSKTPLGVDVSSIGIWMSGGADSALLCYLLAEKIKTENIQVTIQPITIDYKRPFAFIALEVVDNIKKLLNVNDIFKEHIFYHPPDGHTWTPDQLKEQFHIRNYENFKDRKFQILYSGITTNPPREEQENFNYKVLDDVELKRSEHVKKETYRYFAKDDREFIEYKPFFEINKKGIAELYKEKNILESLFPLTRSCEDLKTVRGHCGKCWWCDERQWAFGRLE
jgi:7-cyano-7-deazaguanine synthase in queuosine biosynthesis